MSWGEAAQLIGAATLVINTIMTWRGNKKVRETAAKVDAVHKATNGGAKRLEDIARAEGVIEGRAQLIQELADTNK